LTASNPHILIVRLSAIGDTVLSVPVLCALRDKFPQATIGWIVEKTSAPLLRGHADLNHLIEVPKGWLKSPTTVAKTAYKMWRIGFDVSLDLQGLSKSAITAYLSGAKRRIGFRKCEFEGRELSGWINNQLVMPTADHVVDRGLEMLKSLGIDKPAASFRLPEYEESATKMAKFILARGFGGGFVVINTGAGWPSKIWPAERYAAVARHLGRHWNLPSVVSWAGPAEQQMADQIIIKAGGYAHMAPPTSLTELASLARRSRMFLGSDTGPLHIAAAVGTPCVGLYGPMPAKRCGPYGMQHIALQNIAVEGKLKNRKSATNQSMLAIGIHDVCVACDKILDRQKAAKFDAINSHRSMARAA
jgi:heptosyltransferase-1